MNNEEQVAAQMLNYPKTKRNLATVLERTGQVEKLISHKEAVLANSISGTQDYTQFHHKT